MQTLVCNFAGSGVVRIRGRGRGRGGCRWYALRAKQSSEKHFATYLSSSVWFIEPLYTNRTGRQWQWPGKNRGTKFFPPAILFDGDKIWSRASLDDASMCSTRKVFLGRELDSEWTKDFYFWMESELLRYVIEIQFWNSNCLQSFSSCFARKIFGETKI